MTTNSPTQWLIREVDELLDAGAVGLYELIWLLNGSEFDLTGPEKKEVAQATITSIVNTGRASLHELNWPENEPLGDPIEISALDTIGTSWSPEESERYLALVSPEET